MASPRPSFLARIDRVFAPVTWVVAALVVAALFVGPSLIRAENPNPPAVPPGAQVFESAGCGGCHTLAAAGATGAVGPNLDEANLSASDVEAVVTDGRGAMPSFAGRLPAPQIRAVAAFVAGGEEPAAAEPPADQPPEAREPEVTATIRAGRGPDGITVDDEGTAWVANARAGTLVQIPADGDATAGQPTPAGRQPDSPVVAGGAVWLVASADDTVLRIEDGDVTTIPVGNEPSALDIEDGTVWVANAGDGTVTRIDQESGQVTGEPIEVGARPNDLAVSDGVVWVSSFDDGTVTRLDADSGRAIGEPTQVGRKPRGVAIGEGAVWVANAGDGTVARLDPGDGAVTGDPIPVGENPRELAIGEGFVWVANAADSTVSRIDASSGEVVGEPIPVGEDPIGIAVGGGAVWTADFRGNTVTRIRP